MVDPSDGQGQLAASAIAAVSNPAIAGQLSELGQALTGAAQQAIASCVAMLPQGAASFVGQVADATYAQASALAGSAVADTIGDVSSSIPILGGLIGLGLAAFAGPAASGNGLASDDDATRVNTCSSQYYYSVQGSGQGGAFVPADTWNRSGWNSYGPGGVPTVGDALDAIALSDHAAAIRIIGEGRGTTVRNVVPANDPGTATGIDPATRHALFKLRMAIALHWRRPDGGRMLWPIYLDLLSQQFAQKKLDWGLATWLVASAGTAVGQEFGTWSPTTSYGVQTYYAAPPGWTGPSGTVWVAAARKRHTVMLSRPATVVNGQGFNADGSAWSPGQKNPIVRSGWKLQRAIDAWPATPVGTCWTSDCPLDESCMELDDRPYLDAWKMLSEWSSSSANYYAHAKRKKAAAVSRVAALASRGTTRAQVIAAATAAGAPTSTGSSALAVGGAVLLAGAAAVVLGGL